MSQPISAPVAPTQPNTPFYGVGALQLFVSYTRETYRAAFGVEAPPFDPSRVVKTWFDTTADTSQPDNVSIYGIPARGSDGLWTVKQFVIPALEASLINLTGVITYPPYVTPPTKATRGDSTLNPQYMTSLADAQALMSEIGGTAITEENLELFPVTYPPDENRRIYQITFKGHSIYAGLLLVNKYAKGVGAPGHWDLGTNEPVWVADPPAPSGLDDTRPPRPIPIRPLLPNEKFQETLTGVMIERVDLQQPQIDATGQFTPDDRFMLQQIFQTVVKS